MPLRPTAFPASLTAAVLLWVSAAAAQTYEHPSETAALDTIVQSLTRTPDAAPPTAADLVELSRLLSSPCDQLRWLLARAQTLAEQADQKAFVRQLAQAAAARGQQLAEQGLLTACAGVLEELAQLAAVEEPLETVTDPDALRERLTRAEELTDLTPEIRFALLARGAPAERIVPRGAAAPWDAPRTVLDRLAATTELPPFAELLRLRQQLATAHEAWTGTPTAAAQPVIWASFQIAAALLDRALGLDVQDLAGVKQPITYDDRPAAWAALADTLDEAALWSWATLARVLAAGPPAGSAAAAVAVAAARAPWDKLRKVNNDAWPAVSDAQNGWLVRLGAADRLTTARMLPLAQGFRAAQHVARRAAEEKVRGALSGANTSQAADEVLRNIQLAKAADLGADAPPLGLEELKRELGGELPWVYLFVEVLELRETAGTGGERYCGVALYRTQYVKPMQGVAYEDRYDAKTIGLKATPEDVVREALASPGPPLLQGQLRKDARLIVALDGPPAASWFPFERQTLLEPTNWSTTDPSWLVYLPSASALTTPHWTLEDTLRAWYRIGLRNGVDLRALAADPRPLTKSSCGPPLDREGLSLFQVTVDASRASGANRLNAFLAEKRAGELPALALGVSKGARRDGQ